MKLFLLSLTRVLVVLVIFAVPARAQFTVAERNQAIEDVIKLVNERYVYPETAKKMEDFIRKRQSEKSYDTILSGTQLAEQLTYDLRKVSNDLHINISYSASILPPIEGDGIGIPAPEREAYAGFLKNENYGIAKLDVLQGNIGYVDFKFFCAPEFAGDTYAAAMNYLAHTDALIIDLRNSSGSMSPDAIPFLCSYFFENPVHLNDLFWRKGNITNQYWTYSYVPGKKYTDKPIYVLTSGRTFSGAEELAYDLKNLKRATLVGDRTAGGANPGGTVRINDHFQMFLPLGAAINPITKTNWEGVGVQPDTSVSSTKALFKAHLMALSKLSSIAKDAGRQAQLKEMISSVEKNAPTFISVPFELTGFAKAKEVYVAGSFNNWSPRSNKMERKGNRWITRVEGLPGKIAYKFIVDDQWILDPANSQTVKEGAHINSVKEVRSL